VNHRDRRLVAFGDRLRRAIGDLFVMCDRFRRRPLRLELTDIGSGDEGFFAFAPENNHPNIVVGNEPRHNIGNAVPHIDADSIPPIGIVEGDPSDPIGGPGLHSPN
jgi:hypothetical protein